jgi:hypothetical protein
MSPVTPEHMLIPVRSSSKRKQRPLVADEVDLLQFCQVALLLLLLSCSLFSFLKQIENIYAVSFICCGSERDVG